MRLQVIVFVIEGRKERKYDREEEKRSVCRSKEVKIVYCMKLETFKPKILPRHTPYHISFKKATIDLNIILAQTKI